ncbi:probable cytochrome P450 313a4 isoform X2 [Musca autumnalis]|uniref:probable cytochrome P450 313a4 isoform X2 n=1 Tax=Musca autumnalis TaxID=221902 RepID=UPI003CECE388
MQQLAQNNLEPRKDMTSPAIISAGAKTAEKLGQTHLCYIGPFPQFVTGDPQLVKEILTSPLCFYKGDITYHGMHNAFGKGLLTMQGPEWLSHRKLMDVGFKYSKIVGNLPIFNKKTKGLFERMDKCHVMKNSYDILVYFREFTLKVTGETLLGRDFDKSNVDMNLYAKKVTRVLNYLSDITFKPYYRNSIILKLAQLTIFKEERQVLEFLGGLIDEAFKHYGTNSQSDPEYGNGDSVLAAKVQEYLQNNIIERELAISSMIHLFCAAFETTSMTFYFVILMLAMYPEYQEKAFAEVSEIFPDNDDGEFDVTNEDILRLRYLDMFIKETLRLLPTIPQFGRRVAGGNLQLSNDIVIPEDLEIIINIFNMNRNKDIWGPEADKFNPDKFLPCNTEKLHPYAFIPFSKGLRSCIGMRYSELLLRMVVAKIIKRYKFSTAAKLEDLELQNHISTQLIDYPSLTVERR